MPSPAWSAPSNLCPTGPIGLGILVGVPGISNRLNSLGCHRTNKKCLRLTSVSRRHFHCFVRTEGVEPSRASAHCHLKTARLPFRHVRRQTEMIACPRRWRNYKRVGFTPWIRWRRTLPGSPSYSHRNSRHRWRRGSRPGGERRSAHYEWWPR